MWLQREITLRARPRGFHLVTDEIVQALPELRGVRIGLLHVLLGLPTLAALRGHARAGASFEGFAMTAVVDAMGARPHECSFWATYSGAELDLLVQRGDRRVGVEFKLSSAPELTPSMRIALEDLDLERVWVVHAGKDTIKLAPKVTALPLAQVASTKLW